MEALKELDARTATVEEAMEVLDVPRDEAEYILHQMRSEFEPDIIVVPTEPISEAAFAIMPVMGQRAYLDHEQTLQQLMKLLPPERWQEIGVWLVTRDQAEAERAVEHCMLTGEFPPPTQGF